jgi:DNA replication protein DnaC
MMTQQTMEKLRALRLRGMAEAYQQQLENPDTAALTFDERLALLVDQHVTWRENKAMARRLKTSQLDAEPCAEDINYRHPRQLDAAQFRSLLNSQWVAQHHSVLLTGPTGIGKSWLAQALAHKSCRDGYRVLYRPAGKLFRELSQAQADGSLSRLLLLLTKVDVLVVDDSCFWRSAMTATGVVPRY